MEIALQGQSKGIYYEGYDKTFIQCIFEEGEVQGRNERYEFRLMIIFIILALLLLLAILGTLAWLCAKRPKKGRNNLANASLQKSDFKGSGYASLKHGNDRLQLMNEHDTYSTPEPLYATGGTGGRSGRGGEDGFDSGYAAGYRAGFGTQGGYGNRAYGDSNGSSGLSQRVRDVAVIEGPRHGNLGRRGSLDSRDSVENHHFHETVEESYRQEVKYERPASSSSQEML